MNPISREFKRSRCAAWTAALLFAMAFCGGVVRAQQDPSTPPPDAPASAEAAAEQRSEQRNEEATAPEDVTITHRGTFVRAEGDQFVMSMARGDEHTHKLQPDAKITLNGKPAQLSDLRPGDRLMVTSPKIELSDAVGIVATRGNANQPAEQQGARPSAVAPEDPALPPPLPPLDQNGAGPAPERAGQRGALGIQLDPLHSGAAFVREVAPDSGAARAGLQPGDYILAIDGQKTTSAESLARMLENRRAGEQVQVQIWRNGEESTLQATLGAQRAAEFRQEAQQPQQPEQPREGDDRERLEAPRSQGAWLGIIPRERAENPPGEGVEVAQVHPGGPASRAGMREGDVLTRLDGHAIGNLNDLYQTIGQLPPGKEVEIVVLRQGEEQKLTAKLASREDSFFGGPPQVPGFFGAPFGNQFPGPDAEGDRFGQFGFPPDASTMPETQQHREQHQRMEELLSQVLEEVKQLRREVQQLQHGESTQPANP